MRVLLTGGNPVLQGSMATVLRAGGHEVDVDRSVGDERPSGDGARTGPAEASPNPDVVVVIDRSVVGYSSSTRGEHTADDPGWRGMAAARTAPRVVRITSRNGGPGANGFPAAAETRGRQTTIRTGLVYGTGTDPITQLLIMMRSLPAVPLPAPHHTLRPLWHGDLDRVLLTVIDGMDEDDRDSIAVAGADTITWQRLCDVMAALIDRRPVRIPLPDLIVAPAARLLARLDERYPAAASPLATLNPKTPIDGRGAEPEAITGRPSTRIVEGLRQLIRELPEITPVEGTGSIEVKLFGTIIRQTSMAPEALISAFRSQFADVMPIAVGVEPVLPGRRLEQDAPISMQLPGRGHVQVRVADVGSRHVMVATTRGHVVAGVVRFGAQQAGDGVRFEVLVCDAAANPVDWLALGAGGGLLQDANWMRVVHNVVTLAGGVSDGVYRGGRRLDGDDARRVQRGIAKVIEGGRRRKETEED